MNFKFEIDEEASRLRVTVTVKPTKYVSDLRVRLDAGNARKLVEENFDNSEYEVGPCANSYERIDNRYADKCEKTWLFELTDIRPKPKSKSKKATKATTTTKRSPRRKTNKAGD